MDRLNSEVKKEINSLDFTTKEHSKRCAEIADKVASYLGYDEKDRSFLVNAAAIHDVGKRFIPVCWLCYWKFAFSLFYNSSSSNLLPTY